MIYSDRILIVKKDNCSIYGRVINVNGKIGKYEVIHDFWGNNSEIYHSILDAEKRMQAVVGSSKFPVNNLQHR